MAFQKTRKVLVSGPIFDTPAGPSGQGGKLYTQLINEGYEVYKRSKIRNKILRVIDTLSFVVLKPHKYQIILIQMFSNMAFVVDFLVIRIAKILRKPTVPIIRGGAFVEFYNKYPNWVGNTLKKASAVASPSLFIGEFLKSKGINCIHIPNFIETQNFPYKWEANTGKKLLWVRAFTHIYKPEMAIRLIDRLKDKYPDIKLSMVGPDQGLQAKSEALIKSLNLEAYIDIIGPVPNNQLTDWYASHNVYINTTSYESFGVALVEAACSGIPVVTTDVGEIPYMWQNNEEMMVVKDNDEDAFYNAVVSLLDNLELQKHLSKNANKKAITYSWSNIKQQWFDIIENTKTN